MNIIKANACYTGGGIYQYSGQFDNGTYCLTFTDYENYIMVLDVDPLEHYEESGWEEWQQEHLLKEYFGIEANEILLEIMAWIMIHEPKGNYSSYEIERAYKSLKESV